MSDTSEEKPSVRLPTPRLVESVAAPAPSAGVGPQRNVIEARDAIKATEKAVAESAATAITSAGSAAVEQQRAQQMSDAEAFAQMQEHRTATARVQAELPGKLIACAAIGVVFGIAYRAMREAA